MPLLAAIDFRNPSRAHDDISRLCPGLSPRTMARIEALLGSVPDPDEALHYLERMRREQPAAFARIGESLVALHYLVTIFSYSAFLSEAVIKTPEWILEAAAADNLHRVISSDEFEELLARFLPAGELAAVDLARFRRRQLLRIVLRDALGFADLSEITEELANLSDSIQSLACRRIRAALAARHGVPRYMDETGAVRECGFAVISLGKLGGKELNYSSDIDLMFLYEANGETDGPDPIANREFYKKAANQFTKLLSTYTAEGLCYRVDLRLRPEGSLGEVVISLDGAKNYYERRARDWELQMMIKARVSAGDYDLGCELLDFVDPRTYSTSLDFKAIESVSATRERIGETLAAKRTSHGALNVKLSPGGIRDIEFLVQCLQRLHGGREPWVRHGGTQLALFRLHGKGLLSEREYSRLFSAYGFLRHLEHRLQFEQDLQNHTLPVDSIALDVLAHKMPIASGALGGGGIQRQIEAHYQDVLEIYRQVIHAQRLLYGPMHTAPVQTAESMESPPEPDLSARANLARSLSARAPKLAELLSGPPAAGGRRRLDHFLEKVSSAPDLLNSLESDPELTAQVADLFNHSPYFADQLIRDPALISELPAGVSGPVYLAAPQEHGELRRFYRRRMLRIQAGSLISRAPIFETLEKTSDLADSVIDAVYRMALARRRELHGGGPSAERMSVIALGRLGTREFDLASDADLVFVVSGCGEEETAFWTGVAQSIVGSLGAYTGDGVIFLPDTRLRPNGREGPLVQSEEAYKEYFAKSAEAWEGISYMKARAVAGNVDRGTEFLHELQEVDWKRYGRGGRSRQELAHMRARLEREQGGEHSLKAGFGGYYDIDFILMYLRLKAAGIFYKVLNTPERIKVIEQTGHLDPEDADFLRDAATFYRAIDHAARVSMGHPGFSPSSSASQAEVMTSLARRWTPPHLHDQPLEVKLSEVRTRTRELFERIFGR
jgi:glutamate-ammonia-ligase adenylyltransferase